MPTVECSITAIQIALLGWFEKFQRDFPWRQTLSAYEILIAEKLLQQTAAKDVTVQTYARILKEYPSPYHLCQAQVTDIEAIIRPIGLVYRAKELQMLGQELMMRHNGQIPDNLKELLALPGIGDYAARAVLSFAYNEDVPVVDTNVARFFYRLYGLEERLPSNPSRKKSLIILATKFVPVGRSKEWNIAILDLCALICKPRRPQCVRCPLQKYCKFGSGQSLEV